MPFAFALTDMIVHGRDMHILRRHHRVATDRTMSRRMHPKRVDHRDAGSSDCAHFARIHRFFFIGIPLYTDALAKGIRYTDFNS
jgi:hypothetical protein